LAPCFVFLTGEEIVPGGLADPARNAALRIVTKGVIMRLALFVLLCVPAASDDVEPKPKKPAAREIKVDGLPRDSGPMKVNGITGRTQLEFYLGKMGAYKKVIEQVDFTKEQLVLLRWSGSGQDSIELKKEKDGRVIFKLTPGKTGDKSQHVRLFAVPLKTEYKVAK
jgi:hypothetical protein